jgi:hypothetical protein
MYWHLGRISGIRELYTLIWNGHIGGLAGHGIWNAKLGANQGSYRVLDFYVHLYNFYVVGQRINSFWIRVGTHFLRLLESIIFIEAPSGRSLRSTLELDAQPACYDLPLVGIYCPCSRESASSFRSLTTHPQD